MHFFLLALLSWFFRAQAVHRSPKAGQTSFFVRWVWVQNLHLVCCDWWDESFREVSSSVFSLSFFFSWVFFPLTFSFLVTWFAYSSFFYSYHLLWCGCLLLSKFQSPCSLISIRSCVEMSTSCVLSSVMPRKRQSIIISLFFMQSKKPHVVDIFLRMETYGSLVSPGSWSQQLNLKHLRNSWVWPRKCCWNFVIMSAILFRSSPLMNLNPL